jgi:hypothetical protein
VCGRGGVKNDRSCPPLDPIPFHFHNSGTEKNPGFDKHVQQTFADLTQSSLITYHATWKWICLSNIHVLSFRVFRVTPIVASRLIKKLIDRYMYAIPN